MKLSIRKIFKALYFLMTNLISIKLRILQNPVTRNSNISFSFIREAGKNSHSNNLISTTSQSRCSVTRIIHSNLKQQVLSTQRRLFNITPQKIQRTTPRHFLYVLTRKSSKNLKLLTFSRNWKRTRLTTKTTTKILQTITSSCQTKTSMKRTEQTTIITYRMMVLMSSNRSKMKQTFTTSTKKTGMRAQTITIIRQPQCNNPLTENEANLFLIVLKVLLPIWKMTVVKATLRRA